MVPRGLGVLHPAGGGGPWEVASLLSAGAGNFRPLWPPPRCLPGMSACPGSLCLAGLKEHRTILCTLNRDNTSRQKGPKPPCIPFRRASRKTTLSWEFPKIRDTWYGPKIVGSLEFGPPKQDPHFVKIPMSVDRVA